MNTDSVYIVAFKEIAKNSNTESLHAVFEGTKTCLVRKQFDRSEHPVVSESQRNKTSADSDIINHSLYLLLGTLHSVLSTVHIPETELFAL